MDKDSPPRDKAPEPAAPRRPYRAPVLRSTEAFEKLALQTCGVAAQEEGDCGEL